MDNLSSYFNFDFGKVYITYNENYRRCYRKVVNKKHVKLTRNEFDVIEDTFDNFNPFIMQTIVTDHLLQINTKTPANIKKIIENVIVEVEEYIPTDLRESFYNNLGTVRVESNHSSKLHRSSKNAYGFYSGYDNNLVFVYDNIEKRYEYLKKFKDGDVLYQQFVDKLIAHELFHMASFKSDDFEYTYSCGIISYPRDSHFQQCTGLNESITELFAIKCTNSKTIVTDPYFIESTMLNLLLTIVDSKIVMETYFRNNGIEPIVDEIAKYTTDRKHAYRVITLFEEAFVSSRHSIPSNAYSNYQKSLINLLLVKASRLKNDECNKLIGKFEHYLITPQLIDRTNLNNTIILELESSVNVFYNLKSILYDKDQKNKKITR